MGLIKGILLGSAAGVVMATGSAFAADLPSRKAAPVAYVKICDVYGRGFYYIPGTNTCLKVGGRVRFELQWGRAQNTWAQNATGAGGGTRINSRVQDTLGWKARGYVNLDARTQTAWGTVQTVISITNRARSAIYNGGGFGNGNNVGDNGQVTSPQVYAAYIRFAGFTFGRAPDLFVSGDGFRFYTNIYTGGSPVGNLQLAYTAVFGGGFSATIGIHDSADQVRGGTRINTFANLAGAPGAFNTPNRLPSLVVALRVDQGWGYARLAGALQRVTGVFATPAAGALGGTASLTPTTLNKTGWAVGGVVKINLPALARGDFIQFYAAYCNAALSYCTSNTVNGSRARGKIMGGYMPFHSDVTYYNTPTGRPAQESNKAFAAAIVFQHRWAPTLRSNFGVSYLRVTPGTNSRNSDWFGGIGFAAGGQPRSTSWTANTNIIWSPTQGFDLGLEVHYMKTKNRLACNSVGPCTPWGSAIFSPTTVGVKQNPNEWRVSFRAQRTF